MCGVVVKLGSHESIKYFENCFGINFEERPPALFLVN